MSKRSLVVGMGIGQLYKTVLEKLGHEVITVDSDISKGAMLPTVESAILSHAPFDTVHICTPNFTHEVIARTVARVSKIVFIEKPGLIDSKCWQCLVEDFPETRFMMVKNNMWRNNIADLLEKANHAKQVHIRWVRKNCIPSPGSWFTTRKLAFGGVSRDLMPHLLSLYIAMNPNWRKETVTGKHSLQLHNLESIDSTEYGTVNPNGTYDVDDRCHLLFGSKWTLVADWRTMKEEDSSIIFIMKDTSVQRFELGWCPEEAYHNMIVDAVSNLNNDVYWKNQFEQDFWIHEKIEKL
jgi:predicted dehydrogenase